MVSIEGIATGYGGDGRRCARHVIHGSAGDVLCLSPAGERPPWGGRRRTSALSRKIPSPLTLLISSERGAGAGPMKIPTLGRPSSADIRALQVLCGGRVSAPTPARDQGRDEQAEAESDRSAAPLLRRRRRRDDPPLHGEVKIHHREGTSAAHARALQTTSAATAVSSTSSATRCSGSEPPDQPLVHADRYRQESEPIARRIRESRFARVKHRTAGLCSGGSPVRGAR